MANVNMIGNGNGNSSNNQGNVANVANLREIYSFLEEPTRRMAALNGTGAYDQIVEMIRGLDLQDDGIVMNQKIKAIETDFCNSVRDENMLCESMNYINEKALDDGEIALKFALLFSSRNFDALAMKETKVRSAMLKILETNFLNADTFRMYDRERLYNSITLLGEYYHRVRLADNSPITILGESLIGLLIREVEGLEMIDAKLAKLILSQMTLNGDIMRTRHQVDIRKLLFHIRRNLVEQPKLSSKVKALLLMILDLYYCNFANLGAELENFYTKYLVLEEESEGNNNKAWESNETKQEKLPKNQEDYGTDTLNSSQDNNKINNLVDENEITPPPTTTKKWSEQVCEDSMFENEFSLDNEANNENVNSETIEQNESLSNDRNQYKNNRRNRNARSPRPLKKSMNDRKSSNEYLANHHSHQRLNGEETDQTKPLPRWRAPRFNRDEEQSNDHSRNRSRRLSGSFDDDHQSVRSEGGSIRLYSIQDRSKHAQEKMERSNNNFSFMVNSNWDRQSQRDDRSERSYISNYEYGHKQGRGYRNYNNRQNYDKPPRFQRNRNSHQQQQQNQQQPGQQQQQPGPQPGNDNWRRTRTNSNQSFDENHHDDLQVRTLPRPSKSNYDGNIKSASFRRSQSPKHMQNRNPRHFNNSNRYGSHSSIHSEDAGSFNHKHNQEERNHHPQHNQSRFNNHRGGRRFQMQRHQQVDEQSKQQNLMDNEQNLVGARDPGSTAEDENNELVRNARQTTDYMNYLSSKK